jgi:hypothetical protein
MWIKETSLCCYQFGNVFMYKETYTNYCNPNLGLVTKARACKRTKQEGDPKGTPYTPGSAGECERMNPHTPKATPT